MKFKTGNIVKLKSGGPEMTVRSVGGSLVICQWFAGKKLSMGNFELDSLILATDGDE